MKVSVIIVGMLLLGLSVFSSMVIANNPMEKDEDFLMSDPDSDWIITIDEFVYGTDPFNSDSDNDGLPDWWELEYSPWQNSDPNAMMDPADPSDAHLDFDYEPKYNASGFNIGEKNALFLAVRQLKGGKFMTWPSNPDVRFIQPVFEEREMHYDNYEEFYRPYTDIWSYDYDVIRYLHTNPLDSNTDDDEWLDPDDYEPLGENDGLSPGGADGQNEIIDQSPEQEPIDDNTMIKTPSCVLKSTENSNYDINPVIESDIKQSHSTSQSTSDNKNDYLLLDMDNDGI